MPKNKIKEHCPNTYSKETQRKPYAETKLPVKYCCPHWIAIRPPRCLYGIQILREKKNQANIRVVFITGEKDEV